ncbi:peptidoglycan DD-metalloendopeptidase family protein [Synechocystis sp. PCC 7509]|uniref:peptidoglycan DD-metalloendopeptidase family protein n=1 Tax=Synechocystis sp. PCC 7509 TaxID=927677 RepID=UPI000A064BBB
MKRAWTKKVKSLPSCIISKDALEGQLQPHPKVKMRIFRTSAAMIGLTVSIGAPNLLLVQAAQLPEKISSTSTSSIEDSAAPETVQNTVVIAPVQVEPIPAVTPPQVAFALKYRQTARQLAVKPSHQVVQSSAPATNFTPKLPSSSQIEAQPPALQQHQQAASLEQKQAITPRAATTSQTTRSLTWVEASRSVEIIQTPAANNTNSFSTSVAESPVEVVVIPEANSAWTAKQRLLINRLKTQENPAPLNQAPALPQAEVVVIPEANSAWTAKQRLLINRLKTQENPAPLNQAPAQVSSSVNLVLPEITNSQPMAVLTNPEQGEEKLANEVPEIGVTTNQGMEFEAQPSPTEALRLPVAVQDSQNWVTPSAEIAQSALEAKAASEQSVQASLPVFVLPSVVPQELATPTEAVKEVDNHQLATQNTREKVEQSTPAKAEVPSINEPIIVNSMETEYQVKSGDTLTNIASLHRLSLPEIAKFNDLHNPDLLLVDQKLKLPALTSMKTQANVVVLPPIEEQPLADAKSSSVSTLRSPSKVTLVSTNSATYTGIGGNITEAEAEAEPLKPTALNELQVQYAQQLQNDVQKLKQKYYAHSSSNLIVPVQAVKSDRDQEVIKPRATLGNEPVNPEFRVAQTSQDLKPVTQKQLLNKTNYSAPATVRGRVATAPTSLDNSNASFSGQQVTPELPPLDPVLNYLPQPNGAASFNGYIWPARGALTSKYGWRWGRMHRGIDIAAPVGTPIFAVAPGVVIKSGWNKGGYGNLVDIQHADGTLTRYAHNYRLLVQPGQFVEQGQQISLMGSTGRSTGPHLHFELHPGGKGAVNPMALLPKAR